MSGWSPVFRLPLLHPSRSVAICPPAGSSTTPVPGTSGGCRFRSPARDTQGVSSSDTDRWRRVGPALDHALALDPAERQRWLEDFRQREPDIAVDLDVLLRRYEVMQRQGFLQDEVVLPSVGTAEHEGQMFGRYRLAAPIGRGGMGSVWLAHRADGQFDAQVAIKLPRSPLLDARDVERFRRESTALARLEHPNVARLIDAGVGAGGQPYIALEYVRGERIDAYCDRHTLDVEARLRLFLNVLAAVSHAHSQLVVHRDLKPSNVLVTDDGLVKLLDFGIAQLMDSAADAAPRDMTVAFTPAYASPEQLLGKPISTVSDVYSLGVLLYELLAGTHPLGAGQSAPAAVLGTILKSDAPRLSQAVTSLELAHRRAATPLHLQRVFRGDLDNILAKAMHRQTDERYQSVGALAEDLRRFLQHEPVTARSATVPYRVGKFVRRYRGGVAIASVALLAVFASLGVALWQGAEARRQADLAREEAQRARDAGERAAAVRDFLFEVFAEARPSSPGASMPNASDVVRSAARRAREDASMNALARTELLTNLAGVLGTQGDIVAYRDLLKETYADASTRLGPNHEATLRAGRGLVQALGLTGDRAGARVLIEELRPRVPPELGSLRAALLSLSSQLHVGAGAYDLALPDAQQAVEICRRDCSMEVLSDALTALANTRANADDPAGAIEVWEEALALERRHYGDRHARVASTMAGMSRALRRNGDLQRAEEMARSALQINKAVLGPDDLSLSLDYNALMAILRARRDYDGALAAAVEAARIARVTGGPNHHQLAVNLSAVGAINTLMGRPREALEPLAESVRINERIRDPEHVQTAIGRGSYGEALARSGNWAAGEGQLRHAIRSLQRASQRDAESEATTIAKLARLLLERGDAASALGLFQEMGRVAQTRGGRGLNQQARAAAGEARSLAKMGRDEAALAAITRARTLSVDLSPSDPELELDLQLLDALLVLRSGDRARARQGLGPAQTALSSLKYPPAFLSLAMTELADQLR